MNAIKTIISGLTILEIGGLLGSVNAAVGRLDIDYGLRGAMGFTHKTVHRAGATDSVKAFAPVSTICLALQLPTPLGKGVLYTGVLK